MDLPFLQVMLVPTLSSVDLQNALLIRHHDIPHSIPAALGTYFIAREVP